MTRIVAFKLALSALAFVGSALTAANAVTMDAKVSALVASPAASGQVGVIARFDAPVTIADETRITRLGGDVYRHLNIVHSVAVRLPRKNLKAFAAMPHIAGLSFDGAVAKCDTFTDTSSTANVARAQYGVDGTGVTVAVVDSGIYPHSDFNNGLLQSRVVARASFVPLTDMVASLIGQTPLLQLVGQAKTDLLGDGCGHATHVAGLIAGSGAASTGTNYSQTFKGIASGSNLVSVQVLDAHGSGTVSNVVAGIQWVVANAKQYKIRVLNLSLGHPVSESYTTDPICQAAEAAWKAGIVVLAAAGNEGRLSAINSPTADNEGWGTAYGSIDTPGNDPYVITVGAMKSIDGNRANDKIATYSSRGPSRGDLILKPDLVAPGNLVISTLASGSYLDYAYSGSNKIPNSTYVRKGASNASSYSYFRLSGTSMATPVVAGAVALMLQSDPTLNPNTVKARLMITADKLLTPSGTGDAFTYGAGYLNVDQALGCHIVATDVAMSPTLYVDSGGNLAVEMNRAVWGKTGLYGTYGIWGTNVNDMRAVWGKYSITDSSSDTDATRAVWGKTGVSASRAVWGRESVWDNRAVWGSSLAGVDLSSVVLKGE